MSSRGSATLSRRYVQFVHVTVRRVLPARVLTEPCQTIKIDWKEDSKNLTKLHPRALDDLEDELPAEPGSFFNFFEAADDPFSVGVTIVEAVAALTNAWCGYNEQVGITIANEIFPEAIEYFLGQAGGDEDVDSDEEDESDDDDDAEEIDLEKPRAKKARKA